MKILKEHISLARRWHRAWYMVLCCLCMTVLFSGYAAAEEIPPKEGNGSEDVVNAGESHTLVACFSATGHTMPLAEYVADILGADLYDCSHEGLCTDPVTEIRTLHSLPLLCQPLPSGA